MDAAADGAIQIGLASHNLFDVALGLIWADLRGLGDRVQIEMLEGMANHQRRAIAERKTDLLLYAPACTRDGFLNAIGYLVRRLDENTGPNNFLRHAFRLQPDSADFESLADGFRKSLNLSSSVNHAPHRNVDRNQDPQQPRLAADWSQLIGEPNTDWSVPANAVWAQRIVDQWQTKMRSPSDSGAIDHRRRDHW